MSAREGGRWERENEREGERVEVVIKQMRVILKCHAKLETFYNCRDFHALLLNVVVVAKLFVYY